MGGRAKEGGKDGRWRDLTENPSQSGLRSYIKKKLTKQKRRRKKKNEVMTKTKSNNGVNTGPTRHTAIALIMHI